MLHANRKYKLMVGQNVLDANGQQLATPFVKLFRTKTSDRQRPLPQNWRVVAPTANSRQPLRIEFGEQLDHALQQRLISVHGPDEMTVEGRIESGSNEQSWKFKPATNWLSAPYTIRVDDLLEDLAGNTPLRLFRYGSDTTHSNATKTNVDFSTWR